MGSSKDFDEYDYLEKTVEEGDKDSPVAKKSERSHRKRDSDEKVVEDGEHRGGSKKPRGSDERERDKERERDRSHHRSSRDREREREKERGGDRGREKERGGEREREKERGGDRERERERGGDREREKERGGERDREKERERREREKERERPRSRSRSKSSRRHEGEREREVLRERERELEARDSRRYKEKKEALEPEADPERDQRTVFAYQMPLKATERDVYEFFSKAGKVRDVRLIMDRNSRRSKGVGYIEFYDVMSVPMAIAMSGQILLGNPVMVKPSEAEKNLVQSNASGGTSVTGPYGAVDRKLYVGNLHFNMTELQLKQLFEAFGPVEVVQLPTDSETGQCKGFGFVQFNQVEHAKAALVLNGSLEIAGRFIKVSSVADHVGTQDSAVKATDLDDDDGGGLMLNAQSRALLMQRLDRSGTATSVAGPNGVPAMYGASLSMNGQSAIAAQALPAIMNPMAIEPIGKPSECLLLKNLFDPATETDPDYDLDIKEDVEAECSKYGRVKHIYVDKNSSGYVYLRFESMEGASGAQQAMHHRWFAQRPISAVFLQPYEYDAKFKGTA